MPEVYIYFIGVCDEEHRLDNILNWRSRRSSVSRLLVTVDPAHHGSIGGGRSADAKTDTAAQSDRTLGDPSASSRAFPLRMIHCTSIKIPLPHAEHSLALSKGFRPLESDSFFPLHTNTRIITMSKMRLRLHKATEIHVRTGKRHAV